MRTLDGERVALNRETFGVCGGGDIRCGRDWMTTNQVGTAVLRKQGGGDLNAKRRGKNKNLMAEPYQTLATVSMAMPNTVFCKADVLKLGVNTDPADVLYTCSAIT